MRKQIITLIPILIVLLVSFGFADGEKGEPRVERVDVPLTDPGKPVQLNVRLFQGDIEIIGADVKNVFVEAVIRDEEDEHEKDEKYTGRHDEKKDAAGMYVIRSKGSGLRVEEEGNVVDVKTSGVISGKNIKLTIKVPRRSSLKVEGMSGNLIAVTGVEGDMEVDYKRGNIRLTDISGSVVANTMSGDVTVKFNKPDPKKPMSFSTFSGDLDVTFPAGSKYSMKMKTDNGEIYSDFKLKTTTAPKKKKAVREDGRFVIKFDTTVHAQLNGGGEEITFKTYSGDIYIRKSK